MRPKEFTDQIVLRVPPPLREEIERKASAEGRSLANMTRRILERALASEPEAA
jgi:predicted HicB family RNase H-like nuclease